VPRLEQAPRIRCLNRSKKDLNNVRVNQIWDPASDRRCPKEKTASSQKPAQSNNHPRYPILNFYWNDKLWSAVVKEQWPQWSSISRIYASRPFFSCCCCCCYCCCYCDHMERLLRYRCQSNCRFNKLYTLHTCEHLPKAFLFEEAMSKSMHQSTVD